MSIKIVAFGQSTQVGKFLEKSKREPLQHDEAVVAQTVRIAQINYLLFAVRDRHLVSEQAAGTNGLVFFLNTQSTLYQQKQYLIDLLESRTQFEGLPVAVLFQRGPQLSLKEVVNFMELYRLKDRASMIKQYNWEQSNWLEQLYGWSRAEGEKSRGSGFHAMPKVVKLKAKYREEVEVQSQKKYESTLKDKDIRGMGVKQQQQVYIDREKEKMKRQNMEKQLANFSRNKKKMAPYDIKPTPNPKIQPNLHFFLKDPNSQPPPQVSIKIQTDQFKQRPPAPAYVPKKTGINTSTQIEQNQLFNFDKEVRPILAILTTKALQTAALEIQEEEQFLKMAKYKAAYQQRVRKQKDHEQKNIQQELRVMKEKDKLLQKHKARNNTIKNIQKRVQCYQMAHNLLKDVYFESTCKLIQSRAYPDTLANHLATTFLDQVFNKTAKHYQIISQRQSALNGVFEKDVVESITKQSKAPREIREKALAKREARMTNRVGKVRCIRPVYIHDYLHFSNFTKYISRHFDGSLEQYARQREEHIQESYDKLQGGQTTQEENTKIRQKDDQQFAANHQAFLLDHSKELCFTSTSNRYERVKENLVHNGLIFMDKDGQIVDQVVFGGVLQKFKAFLRVEEGLREVRESSNMDQGIVIDLAKVPQNIKTILMVAKIPQAQKYRSDPKKIAHASLGLQFWQRKVPILQSNVGETIKWQQVIKQAEGEQNPQSQTVYVVAYMLRRRPVAQFWNLQQVSYTTQPQKSAQDFEKLLQQLSRHYFKSNDFLKEQQEQQRVQRAVSSKQIKGKSRSRKLIQQPKKRLVLKVTSKILREVRVQLDEQHQNVLRKLQGAVQEWKELMEIFDNGYTILFKGKPLESVAQLAKYRKVGDLIVKKNPPKVEVKVEEKAQGEEEKEKDDQ